MDTTQTATKYQTYPKYKPSGISWLGDIPAGWEVKRLKYLCSRSADYGLNIEAENYQAQGVRFIRTSDINDDGYLAEEGVYLSSDLVPFDYLLSEGDILLSRSGTIGRSYVCSNLDEKSTYAGYLVRFRSQKNRLKIRFAYYFFHSKIFFDWIKTQLIETTIGNVNGQKYANIPIQLPSNEEQEKIVTFLDRETVKIDEVVEKKQKLMGLLKEKRQALITHAVTKGLDPKAKMKTSGNDWLGDIPVGWEVKRLNYLMKNIVDKALDNKESEFIVALENIESWTGIFISPEDQKMPEGDLKRFAKGDVLFGKLRPYLAKALLAEQDGLCVGEALIFRTTKHLLNKFLIYRILSRDFIDYIDGSTQGAKMPRAEWEFIKTLKIVYPSIEEQQKIVDYIDREREQIDKVMEKMETQIEELREYRQALITSAVTGKIKVN